MTQMKTGEGSKNAKPTRRLRVLSVAAILLCVYFIYSVISIQIEISNERLKLERVEQQIYEQQLENDELTRALESGGESEYIERIAREKLGYAAADERVFVDIAKG